MPGVLGRHLSAHLADDTVGDLVDGEAESRRPVAVEFYLYLRMSDPHGRFHVGEPWGGLEAPRDLVADSLQVPELVTTHLNLDRRPESEERRTGEFVLEVGDVLESPAQDAHDTLLVVASRAGAQDDVQLSPVLSALFRVRVHPVAGAGDREGSLDSADILGRLLDARYGRVGNLERCPRR